MNETLLTCYCGGEQFNCTTPMALVSVKNKYQVVIPREVREAVGVEVGDLLEAKAEAGKITFTPKSVVDRGVAESLADFAAGRSYGPFKTDKELISSLHRETAREPKARSKRKPRR
jgi:bifunctional DNA-binding transcriptional regulator/antitoxin component of YhaV-PrlF toxin-antitoxin module